MKLKNNNEEENEVIIPTRAEEVEQVEDKKQESQPLPIVRGSKVRFIGTKSYSGLDISQYQNKNYKVKEISNDRVVIADGADIIAAVNIKDCIKL